MTEQICGTEVSYEIQGDGARRILLLHGWGCDRSLMQPVADALKLHARILLVDFPGHGQSGRPPEPWGVPEYASCLKTLLEKTGFIPCDVVAHSFGCRVAVWLAAEYPDLFHRLVLTGAAGIRPEPTAESRKRSARYQKLKKACGVLGNIPLMNGVSDRLAERLRQKYGSRDYNALDEEMRKTFIRVIQQDLSPLYPRIKQSTLLLWGDEDTETPLWMGRAMEKWIPDAGLVILEGGSHFAYLEQIGRFNTIVNHFLEEQAP